MTKKMKFYLDKAIAYAKAKMVRNENNNIALCMGKLTDEQFNYLARHFKSVQRQPFGYVRFEI
jgi:D-mannonate dehydratase